jgi:hypothetical protein
MAFVRMFDNPGDQARYDKAREEIGIGSDNIPDGALVHVAGPGPEGVGGWRVVEIWESEEKARKFDEEIMLPVRERTGIKRPPPVVWDVYNLVVKKD